MIQRIQSLFLFLAAVAGVLFFFLPIGYYYHELHGNYRFFVTGVQCMDPVPAVVFPFWFSIPLAVISGAAVIFSGLTIFFYKKRVMQIRLVAVNVFLEIILIILVFFFYIGKIEKLTQIEVSYQAGIFMPLVALVFLILANRFIRKDEALVKAADRIR
jgi:hypothetical protein